MQLYCPKPLEFPEDWQQYRQGPMAPNPDHEEACPKLKVTALTEQVLGDVQHLRAGWCPLVGAKQGAPNRWLRLVEHASGLVAAREARLLKTPGSTP